MLHGSVLTQSLIPPPPICRDSQTNILSKRGKKEKKKTHSSGKLPENNATFTLCENKNQKVNYIISSSLIPVKTSFTKLAFIGRDRLTGVKWEKLAAASQSESKSL